jgi:hypothetical protein
VSSALLEPASAGVLLPLAARRALGIVNVHADGHCVRFRLDPGRMFERRCYVQVEDDGSFTAGISQRPRYDSDLGPDVGTGGLTETDLTGRPLFRALVGCADGAVADLPHWLDGVPRDAEPIKTWELGEPEVFRQAAAHTVGLACQHGRSAFLLGDLDVFACFTTPPDSPFFWSVTAAGEWSLHNGQRTQALGVSPAVRATKRPLAAFNCDVVNADFTARVARTPGPTRRRSPS